MKMILHILLKDLRRHWMEIAAYLLVCATWAWREAHPLALEWLRQRELIPILLFGLWMLIAVRLVQGECLVGDREFWPTRPYRWQRLMAAKALALVLCLNLPLLVAQLFLLHHAGIPVSLTLVPGLLILQGMFVLFLTFPVAVLASITASIVQWVITVVGLILAGIALSWIPWDKLPDGLAGGEGVASWIGAGILVPAMTLVFLWQFARRRETPPAGCSACRWFRFHSASSSLPPPLSGISVILKGILRCRSNSRLLRTGPGDGNSSVRIQEVNRTSLFQLSIAPLIPIRS
jgi:hypothetical protein